MARDKINKSQAIRDVLTTEPRMKAKDVISKLEGEGVKVNASLVYFIKGKMKAGKQRRKRVIKAARAASATGNPVTLILEVKALAEKAGGFKNLRALVEALS